MTYADDNYILAMTRRELAERNGAELLASQLQGRIREGREATTRHYHTLARFERANAGGLAVWRACKDAHRQGRKTLRVADLLALIEETPTRKEDA